MDYYYLLIAYDHDITVVFYKYLDLWISGDNTFSTETELGPGH